MARWFDPSRTDTCRWGSRVGLQPSKSNLSIARRTTSLAVFRPYLRLWLSIFAIREIGKSNVSGAEAERVAMALLDPERARSRHARRPRRNEILKIPSRRYPQDLAAGRRSQR